MVDCGYHVVYNSFSLFYLFFLMLGTRSEEDLPSLVQLENPRSDEATLVYSADDEIIGSYYVANRTKVKFHELSPYLVDALISTEDERYFDHSGIDGWGLGRAIAGSLVGGKGGGSTITQQLAKMMFHNRPESKWGRVKQKFSEWIIAARLEHNYTKQEILAMYFNQFDFFKYGRWHSCGRSSLL